MSGGDSELDIDRTGISHPPIQPVAPPDGAARILVVARDGEPEQRLALGSEPLVIGRAPTSGLMLAAHEVSRAHCRIEAVADAVSIVDLESTNGTFVGGQRISGAVAWPQDVAVQVGPVPPALGAGGGCGGHDAAAGASRRRRRAPAGNRLIEAAPTGDGRHNYRGSDAMPDVAIPDSRYNSQVSLRGPLRSSQ